MKSHTEYLTFNIPSKMAFQNITPKVDAAVKKSGVKEGIVLVNAMHITASVFINDDEPGLHHDFGQWLEKLAPLNPSPEHYHHNRTGEDNADAHMKRQSWAGKSSSQLPTGNWISAPGNRFSTGSSTASGQAGAGENHRRVNPALSASEWQGGFDPVAFF